VLGYRWHYVLIAVSVLAIVASSISSASAHPITVNSSPEPFASLPSSPGEVQVYFSEPIELSYSKIAVLGPDGSRFDMNDPHNADGDTASVAVTVQPGLPEGVYTVTTKVLSAVDGHVVESAFTFGVGTKPPEAPGGPSGAPAKILSPAESVSRFPGMVGQVMVVGAAFGTLWLWQPLQRVPWLANAISAQRAAIDRNMIRLVMVGAGIILGSNLAMIFVQAIDIEAGIAEAVATKFGNVWMIRMIESSILMIVAVSVYRRLAKNNGAPSNAEIYSILVMGLAVLITSSLIAHGAATGQMAAIMLDFFHNAAASIWIGGLVLMGFVAVPKILSIADERVKSAAVSILIPRFSTVVVTILGIAVITGPLLLFSIESDLSLTLASTYGRILAVKLGLAGVMIAMGAYSQFVIQRKVVVAMNGSTTTSSGLSHFAKSLKAESGVGIALLLMVSLMANGALPAGEFPQFQRQQDGSAFAETATPISKDFVQTIYTSGGRIELSIKPFVVGQNSFGVSFFGSDDQQIQDIESTTIKLTQIEKAIGPISVDTSKKSAGVFTADAAFSLPGTWSVEIEGVRPQSSNMVASLDVEVKPAISSLSFALKEYRIPAQSLPLFPAFDLQRQSVWTGDTLPNSGRIWQFDLQTENYTMHKIENASLITQVVLDQSGRLWYIDPASSLLGVYDPENKTNKNYELPEKGVISGIAVDRNNNLWMPVVQPNKIFKFDPSNEKFSAIDLITAGSRPVGISVDDSGKIWIAQALGRISMVDPDTSAITEYAPNTSTNQLRAPTAVFQDHRTGEIYIAEHDGHTVSVFSPIFETFRRYPSINEGGLPFGMAMDSYGNLWYAQHEIDRIAVIDPRTGEGTEVKIPTAGSFIQWLASDDKGRIWFAEQRGAALGSITITANPVFEPPGQDGEQPGPTGGQIQNIGFSFTDAAGPGIAAGIVISALFYAKSATDLKRNLRAATKIRQ
jgi:copper transport protein